MRNHKVIISLYIFYKPIEIGTKIGIELCMKKMGNFFYVELSLSYGIMKNDLFFIPILKEKPKGKYHKTFKMQNFQT